jgi:hypothetical protein
MKSKSGQQITGRLKSKVNGRCSGLTNSEPKMHGVCNCGVLAASQCCFGTLRGSGER